MKRDLLWVAVAAVLFVAGAGAGRFLDGASTGTEASPAAAGERQPLFYRNPMNPAITSPTPAKDEMGMDYIPVYADEADGGDGEPVVTIRAEVENNLGVRTESVARATVSRRIDTVGYVDFDERGLSHVHLRASGWVEDLRVRSLGEPVREGQLLFRFYSPDLVNAQQEYIQSLAAGDKGLVRASEERLAALGVPADTMAEVRKTRRPQQLVPVYARHAGVVSEINIREGMYVRPEMESLTLADLSSIWLLADVFERQADWVAVGQAAELRLPAVPGKVLKGRVEYIYPTLDPRTRTLKVRLRFDNPEQALKPNMYAEATILATPREGVLTVPRSALIRTQEGTRVIRALGGGRFQPAAVAVGLEDGERVEVSEGLEPGQEVVVSAQFLIDSEANLKASLRRLSAPEKALRTVEGTGVVEAIDTAAGTVNVTHDPIAAIGWPAMTMDFQLLPEADLAGVAPGDRIAFELKEVSELDFRLASLRKAEGAAPAAAADPHAHHNHAAPAAAPRLFGGRGTVEAVADDGFTVTIAHEPMPDLGWPPMTMEFEVPVGVSLDDVKAGDAVEFDLRQIDPVTYELAGIRPAGGHGGRH